MKRNGIAVVLCAFLAACGSSSSSGGTSGNSASGTSFTYGAPQAANSTQLGAAGSQVSGAVATSNGSTTAGSVAAFSSFSGAMATLLNGKTTVFGLTESGQPALTSTSGGGLPDKVVSALGTATAAATTYGFDNDACVTTTATSIAFNTCTVTITSTSGTLRYSINGSLSVTSQTSPASSTLAWDLTATVTETVTGTSPASLTITEHTSGNITVTASTIVGQMLADLSFNYTAGSTTEAGAVSESLALNVTYSNSCPSSITSGTLEAKLVWTTRPAGTDATSLPNAAAKITWTGCGTGTIQFGT